MANPFKIASMAMAIVVIPDMFIVELPVPSCLVPYLSPYLSLRDAFKKKTPYGERGGGKKNLSNVPT